MSSAIEIVALSRAPSEVSRFLDVAYAIYGDDPNWVAPLLLDAKKVLSPANPLFAHAEMQLWVARRAGRDVGRIAGILDRSHNEIHRERTAFFGFFESVDDAAISARLFDAVAAWARGKGMIRLLGPMNPTANDECGLLVAGFDARPVFMMTYNPRYYVPLLEAAGCTKAKDLLAYAFDIANGPKDRLGRFARKFRQREPDIVISPIRKGNLAAQLAKIKAVYNQAWADNWGFVPMTEPEIDFMAERLKPLLTEGLAFVAETPQGPAGFLLAIPDFNEALQPLRGRFFSPGLLRALPYFIGGKTPRYLRCVTLGVVRRFRGRGIEAAMLTEALDASLRLGFQRGEASWILEDNTAVQRVIALFGGEVYKTYRVYERAI
jgi:GNAT superfamily N-acetyltransferase